MAAPAVVIFPVQVTFGLQLDVVHAMVNGPPWLESAGLTVAT